MLSPQLSVLLVCQRHEHATSCPAPDCVFEVIDSHLICIAADNKGTKILKSIEFEVSRSATDFGLAVFLNKVRPPLATKLEVEEYPMHARRIAA